VCWSLHEEANMKSCFPTKASFFHHPTTFSKKMWSWKKSMKMVNYQVSWSLWTLISSSNRWRYHHNQWIVQGNHLYESNDRLLLARLSMLCYFLQSWVKKLLAWLEIEPTTSDISSQAGAFDHPAIKASP